MFQKFKNKLAILCAGFLIAPLLVPVNVLAADPQTNALCHGGNTLEITTGGGDCSHVGTDSPNKLNKLIKTILNLLSALVGVLAVIMIMVAGFRYVTSGGSDEAVKGAKNTILYAIIGLVVVALAQIIVHFVIHTAATPSDVCDPHTHKVESGPNQGDVC